MKKSNGNKILKKENNRTIKSQNDWKCVKENEGGVCQIFEKK